MSDSSCPICFGPLVSRDVAPCMDCGHLPEEINHFREGKHTYDVMEIVDGLRLVLCDFCQVDFGSYDPEFFGLPRNHPLGYETMRFVRRLNEPSLGHDKYCTSCDRRLAFLKFVTTVRERRENDEAC
jgi:hypothetical protein